MGFSGSAKRTGIEVSVLFEAIEDATKQVQEKLEYIKGQNESISIGDMFEMQMLMNHLSQLSESSTSIVSAMNTSIKSMATASGR